MRRMKVFLLYFSLLMILALLSGCYFFPKEEELLAPPLVEPEVIGYKTVDVTIGDIEQVVRGTGSFISSNQLNHFFKFRGGRLKKIYVGMGDYVEAGTLLAELDTDDLLYRIKLQELALEKARINYERVKLESELAGGGNKFDLRMAELDLESNRIQLENLQTELEKSKLIAEISGYVVYITDTQPGEVINAYQNVVRIADPTSLLLEYTGRNYRDFALGAEVQVTIDKQVYKGTVVMTPYTVPYEEMERYKETVRIEVEDLPDGIRLGSSAGISLVLERSENTMIVPRSVLRMYQGKTFVYVLEDGIRVEKYVETGIQSGNMVEILSGLDPDDKVLLN